MSRPAGRRRVWGTHSVVEALRARGDAVQAVFVAAGRRPDPGLQQALEAAAVRPQTRTAAELDRLADGGRHQGVVAVLGEFPYLDLDRLLDQADPAQGPLVVLDQVQDPHNLGAIVRSAYGLGSAGLVLPQRRSAGVTAAVVRTAAGATEHLPIARVGNLARGLAKLKEAGWWLVGAAGGDGEPPEALDLVDRAALVLGSEGRGLRPSTADQCDLRVAIPMAGDLDSLNVSVAAGVLLAEAARQRRSR